MLYQLIHYWVLFTINVIICKFYDEVWISKSRTTCCCRHYWGNNPIVARNSR